MEEQKKYNLTDYVSVVSTDEQILHVQTKGFMSNEAVVATSYEHKKMMKDAIDQFERKSFVFMVDMRSSGVASEQGQELAKEIIAYGLQNGLIGSIEVHNSALTKMTVNRMMKSSESFSKLDRVIVGSLEEAFEKAEAMLSEGVGV